MRIEAAEVEVTLESGKVLHFKKSLGDNIAVQEIHTAPTGTDWNAPLSIHYYTVILSSGEGNEG